MDMEVLAMVAQCCQCKRVRAGDEWILAHGKLEDALTHTYCPVCYQAIRKELRLANLKAAPRVLELHAVQNG